MENLTLFGAQVAGTLDIVAQFLVDALVLIGSSIIIYIFLYALGKTCGIDLPLPGRVIRFIVGLLALPMFSSRTPTARFMTLWDRLTCPDFGKRTRFGLPTTYQGFALHPAKGWFLTREKSCQNMIVSGGVGSGKSRAVVIPNVLLTPYVSKVIFDVSGEIFRNTAGHLVRQGYTLQTINLSDPEQSLRYNPLARAGNDPEKLSALADTCVHAAIIEKGESSIWQSGGQAFLLLCLKMLMHPAIPMHFHNLANLRLLINRISLDNHGADLDGMAALLDDDSYHEWMSFMQSTNPETIGSFLTNAKAALQRWHSPAYARLTASSDIDFGGLRYGKKPVALFLRVREDDLANHRLLLSLFFSDVFAFLTRSGDGRPVFLYLDEAGNYRIHQLERYATMLRKHGVALLSCVQSLEQIERLYPKAFRSIVFGGTSTRIHFAEEDYTVARTITESVGWGDDPESGKRKQLLPPDVLRRMDRQVIFLRGQLPLSVKLKRCDQIRSLRKKMRIPAPPLPKNPDGGAPCPLLDLDAINTAFHDSTSEGTGSEEAELEGIPELAPIHEPVAVQDTEVDQEMELSSQTPGEPEPRVPDLDVLLAELQPITK